MLVCEVWSNRLFKVFPHDASLSRIQPKDEIWVFEVPELANNIPAVAADQKDQRKSERILQRTSFRCCLVSGLATPDQISLQVTTQVVDRKKMKAQARLAGYPFVIAVSESNMRYCRSVQGGVSD